MGPLPEALNGPGLVPHARARSPRGPDLGISAESRAIVFGRRVESLTKPAHKFSKGEGQGVAPQRHAERGTWGSEARLVR